MKRFRLVAMLLALCVLASVSSCKKEGVYTPSEKIKRVYASSTYNEKHLTQSWEWDGKLLESINHYNSDGSLGWTENFSYDGKRLHRVDNYIGSQYTAYVYDGKFLKAANYYYMNELEATANYTYTNGKLLEMEVMYFDSKAKANNHLRPSFVFLPEEIAETVDKCVAKLRPDNQEKGIETINYQFLWEGDNVIKVIASEDGEIVVITLQYDKKNNPTKGFHSLYSEFDENPVLYYSKNNVTKMIITYPDGENYMDNITYQYNSNDYPTMRIENDGDYQFITYYEYE